MMGPTCKVFKLFILYTAFTSHEHVRSQPLKHFTAACFAHVRLAFGEKIARTHSDCLWYFSVTEIGAIQQPQEVPTVCTL